MVTSAVREAGGSHRVKHFRALGTRISIKIHYLFSHIDRFPENFVHVSEVTWRMFPPRHQDYGGAIPRPMEHLHNVLLLLKLYT